MTRLRLGLIGAGRVMDIHVAALARIDEVEIVAVADLSLEKAERLAAQQARAQALDSHELLLELDQVDAVDIAIPPDRHFEVASDALRAGKHVFMDKPMATTLEDAERLHERAIESGKVFMLCHNLLFHPAIKKAHALVADGVLGRPTASRAWSTGWLDLTPGDFRLSRSATGGGAWIDCGSHLLYVLEHFLGAIDETVIVASRGESRLEAEDAVSGSVRFSGGSTASLQISYSDAVSDSLQPWPSGWQAGYELRGTKGTLRVDVLPVSGIVVLGELGTIARYEFADTYDASFAGALSEFVSAIRQSRAPRVSSEDGLRVMRLLTQAEQR